MENKIAVIGSGSLGTALAKVLYDSGHKDIKIYGIDKKELNELSKGINTRYFPESVSLPKFKVTLDIREALLKAKYVVLAVPSKVMHLVVPQILEALDSEVLMINGSKGFYPGTELSLHKGILKSTKSSKFVRGVVSLIGPSHAEEIVLGSPTIVASVDKNKNHCQEVQKLFSNDYFKVYVQTDVRGAEAGAAYKNILAIASGIAKGLGFGINTIAALLTRGMVEMQIFNKAMKGKKETVMGLTGMGDLIVTATSDLSRNFTFGKKIAVEGKKALKTKITIEGLAALDVVYKIGDEKKLTLPIVNFLYSVIHGNGEPEDFVDILWKRKLRSE